MVQAEVLGHKRYGEHYHSLTVVAPDIAKVVKPGQFVNIKCGEGRAHILRRPFSVSRVQKHGGFASTIEIVFDVDGPGTRYLSELGAHDSIDLIGPLGRGFSLPKRTASCLLIGGGIGAAPLFVLADALGEQGHRVDVIFGARDASLLLNPIDARRVASLCRFTTEDGSAGDQGRVTDVMPEVMDRCDTQVVYACGPHPMLEAVSKVCMQRKIPVQVAVEELMACGYGVCMTCVIPVRTSGAEVVHVRSCTEGPILDGAAVVWNGSAPVGAPDGAPELARG
jgi:dihydroorotate dehydrogenase electron transfer subunit